MRVRVPHIHRNEWINDRRIETVKHLFTHRTFISNWFTHSMFFFPFFVPCVCLLTHLLHLTQDSGNFHAAKVFVAPRLFDRRFSQLRFQLTVSSVSDFESFSRSPLLLLFSFAPLVSLDAWKRFSWKAWNRIHCSLLQDLHSAVRRRQAGRTGVSSSSSRRRNTASSQEVMHFKDPYQWAKVYSLYPPPSLSAYNCHSGDSCMRIFLGGRE